MTNQTNNTTSMVRASSDQHTPQKRGEQSQTNQTKNHWHTIEFSHNTRTPKHTPQNRACPKQLAEPYTHPHHKPNRSTRIK